MSINRFFGVCEARFTAGEMEHGPWRERVVRTAGIQSAVTGEPVYAADVCLQAASAELARLAVDPGLVDAQAAVVTYMALLHGLTNGSAPASQDTGNNPPPLPPLAPNAGEGN